jgi:hypothetical protein
MWFPMDRPYLQADKRSSPATIPLRKGFQTAPHRSTAMLSAGHTDVVD